MAATNPLTQPGKQKITAFLWFDNNAEEAANFYVSVFKNSKHRITRKSVRARRVR
jgi:predicted 3-demethylubiquinone-9 3-methyltransferase (glyoxalase superfamily)